MQLLFNLNWRRSLRKKITLHAKREFISAVASSLHCLDVLSDFNISMSLMWRTISRLQSFGSKKKPSKDCSRGSAASCFTFFLLRLLISLLAFLFDILAWYFVCCTRDSGSGQKRIRRNSELLLKLKRILCGRNFDTIFIYRYSCSY